MFIPLACRVTLLHRASAFQFFFFNSFFLQPSFSFALSYKSLQALPNPSLRWVFQQRAEASRRKSVCARTRSSTYKKLERSFRVNVKPSAVHKAKKELEGTGIAARKDGRGYLRYPELEDTGSFLCTSYTLFSVSPLTELDVSYRSCNPQSRPVSSLRIR